MEESPILDHPLFDEYEADYQGQISDETWSELGDPIYDVYKDEIEEKIVDVKEWDNEDLVNVEKSLVDQEIVSDFSTPYYISPEILLKKDCEAVAFIVEMRLPEIYSEELEKPSTIQQRGMGSFCKGHDVIQQAQSGTGKTTTFYTRKSTVVLSKWVDKVDIEQLGGIYLVTVDQSNADDMVKRDKDGKPLLDMSGNIQILTSHTLMPAPAAIRGEKVNIFGVLSMFQRFEFEVEFFPTGEG